LKIKNKFEFEVYGKYGLFTDPIFRVGGEKLSYNIPTYEALRGIAESIYWKPAFTWAIDKMRIMNCLNTGPKGIRTLVYDGKLGGKINDLATYTYLINVRYQVTAHIEWTSHIDNNMHKHIISANRHLDRGGRRDIYLGTRECQGYVEPCDFGSKESYYDSIEEFDCDFMFHSFTYPTREVEKLHVNFWEPIVKNGIVEFCRPEECKARRFIRNMPFKTSLVDRKKGITK
jgi:CRISPR-associated protein Cas5d